jgi:hypothetical protein
VEWRSRRRSLCSRFVHTPRSWASRTWTASRAGSTFTFPGGAAPKDGSLRGRDHDDGARFPAHLPKRNGGDLDDVPEQVRDEIEFHIAESIDDVLGWVLEPKQLQVDLPDA